MVTHQRRKILCLEPCRRVLREVIRKTQARYPFTIDAFVLLPDHLHCIWTLPERDTNYSMRWGFIKKEFTRKVRGIIGDAEIAGMAEMEMVGTAHPTASPGMGGYAHQNGSLKRRVGCAHQRERATISAHYNHSRKKHRESTVWQRRFWEHTIRDQADFNAHVEYIHYNPVKHGYVQAPKDWEYSSFHRYVSKGIYPVDWGGGQEIRFDEGIGRE